MHIRLRKNIRGWVFCGVDIDPDIFGLNSHLVGEIYCSMKNHATEKILKDIRV